MKPGSVYRCDFYCLVCSRCIIPRVLEEEAKPLGRIMGPDQLQKAGELFIDLRKKHGFSKLLTLADFRSFRTQVQGTKAWADKKNAVLTSFKGKECGSEMAARCRHNTHDGDLLNKF